MSDGWSKEELRGAVDAYVEMQRKERTGQPFTKKRYYEKLAAQFGRTEKAFEYRMQNISYVLSLIGRDWLTGLKPAKNVGANVAAEIETLLAQAEGKKAVPVVAFEIVVREEAKKKHLPKPTGNRSPKATISEVTQFQRDATVKAWVLQQANGKCESCEQPAPFNGADGLPYLEVHHVRQLADNGADTVTNAVALCPNCHRELHYGENSQALVVRLYERVSRLTRE
jgi:5-methylcytosine-specific restriction enzyme A